MTLVAASHGFAGMSNALACKILTNLVRHQGDVMEPGVRVQGVFSVKGMPLAYIVSLS